jgi:outer membrane protein
MFFRHTVLAAFVLAFAGSTLAQTAVLPPESSPVTNGRNEARQVPPAQEVVPMMPLQLPAGVLSVDEAIALALENNGNIRNALLQAESSRTFVREAFGLYLPRLDAQYRYFDQGSSTFTGAGRGDFVVSRNDFNVVANWQWLDSGQRSLNLRSAQRNVLSSDYSALTTLRSILFDVQVRYYEALRAQELLRVSEAQVERAEQILEQTKARVEVGEAARKEILQAEADLANARVTRLTAENRVATSFAALEATIGWQQPQSPELLAENEDAFALPEQPMDDLVVQALADRPELNARRESIESLKLDLRRAQINRGVTVQGNLRFQRSFGRDVFNDRQLELLASIPIFDAYQLSQPVRRVSIAVEQQEALLQQDEFNVIEDVKASYTLLLQDARRIEAARVAAAAARLNFESASEAQRLGAADILEVLTAQVTLVTAESNLIQALYDALISEARLRLVSGEPVRGEPALIPGKFFGVRKLSDPQSNNP